MSRFQKILVIPILLIVYFNNANAQNIIVHDPVMIRQDSNYYIFCTGNGISVWTSKDLKNWISLPPVFNKPPYWTTKNVSGFSGHIWAPDISFHSSTYYLYYAISAFAKNTSCIGLATNNTLNPTDSAFGWKDQGMVLQSIPGRDMWNAIDPNLIFDNNDIPWLVFGSFWEGIKMVKLKSNLKEIFQPQEWYTVARRQRDFDIDERDPGNGAIEAPFIFVKNGYYYLFVSFDYCCKGINSNYKIMVGRSENINGPYLDKDGNKMSQGGGTLVLAGDKRWPGLGHNSVYNFDSTDYMIYHAYDASDNGKPKLRISIINWDKDEWPYVIQ
jgi:arabinan endo-1,5-alpha-L-arabinosidase